MGFLFAIAAFLLAYNGKNACEFMAGKLAALAAMGVAMFPCRCGDHQELVPYVHAVSAAIMFIVLAFFCYLFLKRARRKQTFQARVIRPAIYAFCGFTILVVIALLTVDSVLGHPILERIPRLVFYGEFAGLWAFGIAWLTASLTVPGITAHTERQRLSAF